MNSLLLHACCAHCSAYTINYWRDHGFQISLLWYNPNVHPYLEHERRREAVTNLAKLKQTPVFTESGYDFSLFFRAVAGHEERRCQECFQLRLRMAARRASERGFKAFSTTLLISPHQKHQLAIEIGNKMAAEFGVDFAYYDLRSYYSESRRETKPLGLYRQQYCGCIYSEWERYLAKRDT